MARLTATAPNGRVFTRYSEFYTAKHNAVRAARRALGRDALPGREFLLEQTTKGWTWHGKAAGFAQADAVPVARVDAPSVPMAAQSRPNGSGGAIDVSAFDDLLRRIAVE